MVRPGCGRSLSRREKADGLSERKGRCAKGGRGQGRSVDPRGRRIRANWRVGEEREDGKVEGGRKDDRKIEGRYGRGIDLLLRERSRDRPDPLEGQLAAAFPNAGLAIFDGNLALAVLLSGRAGATALDKRGAAIATLATPTRDSRSQTLADEADQEDQDENATCHDHEERGRRRIAITIPLTGMGFRGKGRGSKGSAFARLERFEAFGARDILPDASRLVS